MSARLAEIVELSQMKSRWSDLEFRSVVEAMSEPASTPISRSASIRRGSWAAIRNWFCMAAATPRSRRRDGRDGGEVEVICVKGSGWDMGTIEPAGLPAVRLNELAALARFETLSDVDMVRQQRRLLMDPAAPNPSVEAILHALIPLKHVDHTHANAIVALTNQPDGEALIREVFPDSVVVPYVMPGFDLAKACAKVLAAAPGATGMILLKHGIFTWSDDPRASYEAMIELVDRAERRLAKGKPRPFAPAPQPAELAAPAEIMPILRGRLAQPTAVEGRPKRMVLAFRTSPAILDFCNAKNAAELVSRGNATPEHVIHIKRKGVALPAPEAGKLDAFAARLDAALADYAADYRAYFERNNARVGGDRIMLDPLPRVFYVAGVGIFAAGGSAKAAKVAADVAEATVEVIAKAEGVHGWVPLPEAELFDVEYWSLEQAKLAKSGGEAALPADRCRHRRRERSWPRGRQGAARRRGGGRDPRYRRRRSRQGGEVDRRARPRLRRHRRVRGRSGGGARWSKPSAASISSSPTPARRFQGALATVSDEVFEKAFALNFWGHHYVARAAVRVMEAQGTGGALVFNVSKQAVNPGPDFGPYGTSKAALMALMRQYAIEHGASGITSNAVNADRIRTGLMTDEMVAERSKARGLTPEAYMRGNLLKREVLASDVAAAFVHLVKARASTGAVVTVDGGNVAAMLR